MKRILAVFILLAMLMPYALADTAYGIYEFKGLQYAVPDDWTLHGDSDELRSYYSVLSGEKAIIAAVEDLVMFTDESREIYSETLVSGIFDIDASFDFSQNGADGSYRATYIGSYPSATNGSLEPLMALIVCTSRELYIFAFMPASITGDTVSKFEDLCAQVLLADAADSTSSAVPSQDATYTAYEKQGLRFELPASWPVTKDGEYTLFLKTGTINIGSSNAYPDRVYFFASHPLNIPDPESKETAVKDILSSHLTGAFENQSLDLKLCEADGSYRMLTQYDNPIYGTDKISTHALIVVCSDTAVYLLDRAFNGEPTDADIAEMEDILSRMEVIR